MLKLYENIKKRRIELNISQQELAELVGYKGKSMISQIESGSVDISRSMIVKFAEVLNCSPAYLMGWEDDESGYYLDDETALEAQRVFSDPDTRMLFDAARDSKPENIRIAADLLKRLKETNPDG